MIIRNKTLPSVARGLLFAAAVGLVGPAIADTQSTAKSDSQSSESTGFNPEIQKLREQLEAYEQSQGASLSQSGDDASARTDVRNAEPAHINANIQKLRQQLDAYYSSQGASAGSNDAQPETGAAEPAQINATIQELREQLDAYEESQGKSLTR